MTRDFPTSLLYKSFRNKRIKVNGKKGVPEDRIKAGDLIELYINDEFFPPEGAKPAHKPAPKKQQNQPKVTVIYEDENIAVLYKPTHLLCHSDRTGDANLVDAFTQYLAQKGEYDPQGENRFKPGICNRLDRGTEGLSLIHILVTASTTGFRRLPWQSGHSTPDMKLPISSFIHSLFVSRKRRSRFSTMPSKVL